MAHQPSPPSRIAGAQQATCGGATPTRRVRPARRTRRVLALLALLALCAVTVAAASGCAGRKGRNDDDPRPNEYSIRWHASPAAAPAR